MGLGSCCKSCWSFFFGCCGHQTHDPKSTTLVTERGCTDKLILLLFLLGFAGSVAVISTAATRGGDPQKIISGIDYNGCICGHSAGVTDQPLAALVNPLTTDPRMFTVWTCVDTCNQTRNPSNDQFGAVYGSTEFFGYCVPTFDIELSGGIELRAKSQFDAQFDSAASNLTRGMSDLGNAWPLLLASVFFALIFAYLYIFLTRRFAGVIIWLCILLVIGGGFFLGYSFLREAEAVSSDPVLASSSARRIQAYEVAGYVFIALTSLFVLIILALSSRISLAVEVVKEASRALNDMRLLVFTPLLPLLLTGGYLTYWIYGALYIFSVGDRGVEPMPQGAQVYGMFHPKYGGPTTDVPNGVPANQTVFNLNESFRPLAAYWVFHGLWTLQFLVYFGYFVIAGAVCTWYFTMADASGNKIIGGKNGGTRAPIATSLWRAVRFHVGTIAFAALIIAIVQFIRLTVKYVEMKTRSDPPNYIQKAVFCIIRCCLACIECCLDKISQNALVWTAMWGDPFLTASCSSFALIWRNLARIAAVHVVSDVILIIGKVAIAALTVGVAALVLNNVEPWKHTVSSAFVPCVLIAFIAYFVAWLFFLTFETVIDTTFLCFLVDAENSEKNAEAMFASKGLQELVGKYQLRSAQVSEHQKKEAAEMYKHAEGGGRVQDHTGAATVELTTRATAPPNRAESNNAVVAFGNITVAPPSNTEGHKAAWAEARK